jgi:uridine kinase
MNSPRRNHLVAIVGGSGAGKSWFVERLCALLGEAACRLALDDFYRDRSHLPEARRARINFDAPRAIDWPDAERVLRACRNGESTSVPRYDFSTYCRRSANEAWQPRPVVFIEGLWLLRRPELRALFDLKVFLDTPASLRETRRLTRDVAERGYTADAVRQRLQTCVVPMHDRYVEPQKRWADLILIQPFDSAELRVLAGRLWSLLSASDDTPAENENAFHAQLLSLLADHEYCN